MFYDSNARILFLDSNARVLKNVFRGFLSLHVPQNVVGARLDFKLARALAIHFRAGRSFRSPDLGVTARDWQDRPLRHRLVGHVGRGCASHRLA